MRNEKIGFKIREHTLQKVPYLLIVGDKEMANQQVTVRLRDGRDLGAMSTHTLYETLNHEIMAKSVVINQQED